jgi:hypothetical protein
VRDVWPERVVRCTAYSPVAPPTLPLRRQLSRWGWRGFCRHEWRRLCHGSRPCLREGERDRAVVGPAEANELPAVTEDLARLKAREERLVQKEVVQALGLYTRGDDRSKESNLGAVPIHEGGPIRCAEAAALAANMAEPLCAHFSPSEAGGGVE